ncbi:MAG: tetratricopeptide repeat protein [Firmicutes bacterium]|nr:tetratricopeptide repeat protein [Bacillota bacterium]
MESSTPDLSLVRRLKAKGRYEEAERRLAIWLADDPDNPRLLLEMAELLDQQRREEEAIGYYEAALTHGLDPLHRAEAYAGLGSSLRAVGRIHDSYRVLSEAVREFPQHLALKVLLALTLEKQQNFGEAIDQLLTVILAAAQDPTLNPYRPALQYDLLHRHDEKRKD